MRITNRDSDYPATPRPLSSVTPAIIRSALRARSLSPENLHLRSIPRRHHLNAKP